MHRDPFDVGLSAVRFAQRRARALRWTATVAGRLSDGIEVNRARASRASGPTQARAVHTEGRGPA